MTFQSKLPLRLEIPDQPLDDSFLMMLDSFWWCYDSDKDVCMHASPLFENSLKIFPPKPWIVDFPVSRGKEVWKPRTFWKKFFFFPPPRGFIMSMGCWLLVLKRYVSTLELLLLLSPQALCPSPVLTDGISNLLVIPVFLILKMKNCSFQTWTHERALNVCGVYL